MMSNTDTQTIFTLEVYNRRKWSDRYSLTYATREEAEESARRLYHKDPDNEAGIHISTFYRIRETTTIVTTHEIQ
jgi:hypothetical protein